MNAIDSVKEPHSLEVRWNEHRWRSYQNTICAVLIQTKENRWWKLENENFNVKHSVPIFSVNHYQQRNSVSVMHRC